MQGACVVPAFAPGSSKVGVGFLALDLYHLKKKYLYYYKEIAMTHIL